MAKLTGAHLMVRALKLEGVQKIFTIVGDTILPLVDAVEDEGLEFVDTRHEAAAMHMADAWARVTGEPAVTLFTGGPGFSNAVSALPNIYTSESPVIFISGASELSGEGDVRLPGDRPGEHGRAGDQGVMAGPRTPPHTRVRSHRLPHRPLRQARPGAPHHTDRLAGAGGLGRGTCPGTSRAEYRNRGRSHGDPKLAEEAVALLSRAERPVVIAANAARYSLSTETLQEFIETTGLPVFTVEQARGLVSDDHPLCFGYADGALNSAARRFREADVVLLLGKRFDHRYRYGQPPFFSATAHLIQVDPSPGEIGRNRGVSVGVLGDIGAVVGQLTLEARKLNWSSSKLAPWLGQMREDRESWLERMESFATEELPLHPMKVFKEVDQFTDDNTILIFDGGDYAQWGRSYFKARKSGHWMRLGPLSQLGCGIPFAIGAKLARPDANVLLFTGDGSFGFYAMEYDTAMRFDVPITAVMGNDSTWGIDKNFQIAYYGRAVGTDLRSVRYDEVVEALGGYGEYVERSEDIAPAVGRAIASGRPSLVNVVVKSVRSPLADAMIARKTSARRG